MFKLKGLFKGKKNKAFQVIYGIDQNFIMPASISIRSLIETHSSSTPLNIHILHMPMAESFRDELEKALPVKVNFKIHWHEMKVERIANLRPGLKHVSLATYLRFLAIEVLPIDTECAIYLDGDTVVLDEIEKLFEQFDPKWAVQACQDHTGYFGSPLIGLSGCEKFGILPAETYFNSGVLLFNMKVWREERLNEKLLEFARLNPEFLHIADQNAMNIVLHKRIGTLSPLWNVQVIHPNGAKKAKCVEQDHDHARIFHYTTALKPWSTGQSNPEARYFYRYFDQTHWAKSRSQSSLQANNHSNTDPRT